MPKAAAVQQVTPPTNGAWYTKATFWAPAIAVAFGLLWFAGTAAPRGESAEEMQLSKFARLPILDGGRKKPVDTYAKVHLFAISHRQEYYQEFYKETQKPDGEIDRELIKKERRQAIEWLLSLLADGFAAKHTTVMVPPFLQQHLQLKAMPGRNVFAPDVVLQAFEKHPALKHAADVDLDQLPEKERALAEVLKNIHNDARNKKDRFDNIVKARDKKGNPDDIRVFRIENDQVRNILNLKGREGLRYTRDEINNSRESLKKFSEAALNARDKSEKERDLTDVKAMELYGHLMTYASLSHLDGGLQIVPPTTPDGKWKTLLEAMEDGDHEDGKNPAAASLVKMIDAYAQNNAKVFNKEVDAYTKYLNQSMPGVMGKARRETWFNGFAPFYQCLCLYFGVILLAVGSWIGWREPLRAAAFWLGALVLVVHTFAIVMRIYIMDRPPVTNLYSSAVFIGWGAVLLCLIACSMIARRASAYLFVNSIILAVQGILGFATLIVAHHLGGSGDTMEVMQAVLDTNFWLATHVTTVTLGYTATFVAGFLATTYVFLMLATAVRSFFTTREPYFVGPVTVGVGFGAAGVAILGLATLGVVLLSQGELPFGVLSLLVAAGAGIGANVLLNKWGIREWLRTHWQSNVVGEAAGKDSFWFVLAVLGMTAIPGVLATALIGGVWMLLGDGESMDFATVLIVSIPALAVCGFYAAFVIGKRFSKEYLDGGEMPGVAHFVDKLALRQEVSKVLSWVVYGVICFAMLLSFVGTVLGGIWADQSWGRFWGWDPKENGALLIVIMNAMILHARFGGLVRERGTCVLAILGNMVTAWSWFGTNQLGVGLHAYGFNNTLAFGCSVFWISQLGMAALGLLPLRFWRAYADKPLVAVPDAAKSKVPHGPRLQGSGKTGIQPA